MAEPRYSKFYVLESVSRFHSSSTRRSIDQMQTLATLNKETTSVIASLVGVLWLEADYGTNLALRQFVFFIH